MNTKSINNSIAKETGLKKSEIIKGYAQVCNRSGICYAYRTKYSYSGDFHCKKFYGNIYRIKFDNLKALEKKNDVMKVLTELGCKNIMNENSHIRFEIN